MWERTIDCDREIWLDDYTLDDLGKMVRLLIDFSPRCILSLVLSSAGQRIVARFCHINVVVRSYI